MCSNLLGSLPVMFITFLLFLSGYYRSGRLSILTCAHPGPGESRVICPAGSAQPVLDEMAGLFS